jgi:hypothetical protein
MIVLEKKIAEVCSRTGMSREEFDQFIERDLGGGAFMLKGGAAWILGSQSPPPPPSLAARVGGFMAAAGRHVASGATRATQEEVDRRFAICQSNKCGFYDGRTCRKCGCFVSNKRQLVSKLSWAEQSCPIGLWGPELAVKPEPNLSPTEATDGQEGSGVDR